jgi:ATP-dependent Clp protease protease subunit
MLHGSLEQDKDEHYGKTPIDFVVNGLLYLDKYLGDPIELWINTPGGSVAEMFGLYDVIRTRQNEIVTIGFGVIKSAGVLVLAAGDRRYATENAVLMSHADSPGNASKGDLFTRKAQVAADERDLKRWAVLMGERTKRSKQYWEDVHWWGVEGAKPELYLSAKQMKQFGIVDEILKETAPIGTM